MATDPGNQIITLKFYDPADTPVVNKRQKDITNTGMYKGGYLSEIDSTHIDITSFVCEIQSNLTPFDQVRVEMTSAYSVEDASGVIVGTGTPYVVVRWVYTGVAADDYAEILGVASPDTYDIIIGKVSYSGASITGFTYAERTNPKTHNLYLKVEAEQTASMYVRVRDGYVQIGNSSIHLSDNLYGPFTAPGSGSKTGAVYINKGGAIQTSDDYSYNGEIVLAKIALIASQTTIVVGDITDVRSYISYPAIPDDVTIQRNSSTGKLEHITDTWSSEWFAVTKAGTYSNGGNDANGSAVNLQHNLNSRQLMMQVLWCADLVGDYNDQAWTAPDESTIQECSSPFVTGEMPYDGVIPLIDSLNTIRMQIGYQRVTVRWDTDGHTESNGSSASIAHPENGWCKILVRKIA